MFESDEEVQNLDFAVIVKRSSGLKAANTIAGVHSNHATGIYSALVLTNSSLSTIQSRSNSVDYLFRFQISICVTIVCYINRYSAGTSC